ncbi:restriction endonuclease subunit S [Bergeyella porcorum]|uniref:restriction endonuclease subunit S n=1 Tax=Bergeyella porcorum TaxID=1735111 RepID=UPI0035ED896D
MEGSMKHFFKFIPFSKFDLWDTKRYTSKSINSDFEVIKLGSCIREENKKYKLYLEEEKEFGILGVNNKTGIFDAYTQKGKEINQPYKKMETGWIAYNPYRINVGSIGIRLEEHLNEYISPAYVVFSCKDNVLPEYLFLVFKTETFNKVINENTTGSVRQNLSFDKLKDLEIPLPTLQEQQAIVDAYFSKINESNQLEIEANNIDKEIEKYLFDELGLSKNIENQKSSKLLKTISFNKIDRWAIDYLSKYSKLIFLDNGNYNLIKLREVIEYYQYGLSEKASEEDLGLPMLRMNNINDTALNLNDIKYLKDEKSFERFILNKNDLLFNRTNSKELVGKTAIFDRDGKYTFASYLIRVKINENKADVRYINELFNSSILQIQKDMVSRQITGQANINAQEMQDFLFPMPPLDTQVKIANETSELRNSKVKKLTIAAQLKHQANEAFERAIFQ